MSWSSALGSSASSGRKGGCQISVCNLQGFLGSLLITTESWVSILNLTNMSGASVLNSGFWAASLECLGGHQKFFSLAGVCLYFRAAQQEWELPAWAQLLPLGAHRSPWARTP